MKTRIAASLLLLVAATACDGPNLPGLPSVSGNDGAVRFYFSGSWAGSFAAQGDGVARTSSQWAGGERSRGWITVTAVRYGGPSRQEQFSFDFPEQAAPYTVRFDRSQCIADAPCPGGIVVLSLQADVVVPSQAFLFTKGEIRVTRIADGRVRGTFSGTGVADPGDGTLQLADGSFDVPLVAGN
ncbi:MAG TPA: hypothetical protein VF771_06670 [Longimicrobiaceae bacterium]